MPLIHDCNGGALNSPYFLNVCRGSVDRRLVGLLYGAEEGAVTAMLRPRKQNLIRKTHNKLL